MLVPVLFLLVSMSCLLFLLYMLVLRPFPAVLDTELQLALCAAVKLLVSTGSLISTVGWSVRVV